jgi:hypothetical protein
MTLSDWMDATPSDWMERPMPGWQGRSYGDLFRTSPSEWWSMMYAPFSGQPTATPTRQPSRRHGHHEHHQHHHDCACGCHDDEHGHEHHHHHHDCAECGPTQCECICCLGDVDIAVYTRVGEQRVVPIAVENERRREKTIALELSSWTTRGGNAGPVDTVLLEPKAFTLAPCSEQQVTLVVKVGAANQSEGKPAKKPADDRESLTDVDSCQVVTADLRLVGCDHRAVRIAVAILPRDCDPCRVSCGCTCC